MIKILHSADWHLDASLRSLSGEQALFLRREMLRIPARIAALCRAEGCDMMLLSGDLFDGPYTAQSFEAVRQALEDVAVPVFIAPGNHDYFWEKSPYSQENWPENVYIFKNNQIESQVVEQLSCRVYGGAFTGVESGGMLEGFQAEGTERYAVAVLHGDPTSAVSPYCPVTALQVRESGLDYLALGHIHATGSFVAGSTLAAWPGCAMGHGFDETGIKGALVVTLDEAAQAQFHPISGPRFYDLDVKAGGDPLSAALAQLPAQGTEDFYRVTFTGEAEPPDLERLRASLSQFPNLTLRDRTQPPADLWANADEDSLEGVYFRILRDARADQDTETVQALELAAKISRQILLGQEVELP